MPQKYTGLYVLVVCVAESWWIKHLQSGHQPKADQTGAKVLNGSSKFARYIGCSSHQPGSASQSTSKGHAAMSFGFPLPKHTKTIQKRLFQMVAPTDSIVIHKGYDENYELALGLDSRLTGAGAGCGVGARRCRPLLAGACKDARGQTSVSQMWNIAGLPARLVRPCWQLDQHLLTAHELADPKSHLPDLKASYKQQLKMWLMRRNCPWIAK